MQIPEPSGRAVFEKSFPYLLVGAGWFLIAMEAFDPSTYSIVFVRLVLGLGAAVSMTVGFITWMLKVGWKP